VGADDEPQAVDRPGPVLRAQSSSLLRTFFAAYEARTNAALADPPEVDVEATAAAFAPYFVESSPRGVMGGENGPAFREQIPQGFAFYRQVHTTAMRIREIAPTPLDATHVAARVGWTAHYAPPGRKPFTIDFDVTYLLRIDGDRPTIFAYITGDEEAALRDAMSRED